MGIWRKQEKFRKRRPQSLCDDGFGRRLTGIHGAHPAIEVLPDFFSVIEGKVLEKSLRDAAELNVSVIGIHFSTDKSAIVIGFHV